LMQDRYLLRGELDRDAFVRAWQRVIDRHSVLRTSFVWENQKRPLQVVHKQVTLPFDYFDWRDRTPAEQETGLNALLQAELDTGFDCSKAPLVHLRLIRLTDDTYRFIRSYHHILMDAWCFSLLMVDFFAFYDAFIQGKEIQLERPRPYRDYIAWLQNQDPAAAKAFWRKYLRGFTTPTPLVVDRVPGKRPDRESGVADRSVYLTATTTDALLTLAQQHQLTLNTFIQGAWALLLNRYSGEEKVLFGVTVAGRPPELTGIESMVGLFINSLPLRVQVPSQMLLLDWLKALLAQNVRMRQYEYAPLVQIQAWSSMSRGQALFQCLLVFENAPVDPSLKGQAMRFRVSHESNRTHTNYPLTVVIIPSPELELQLSYDQRLLDETTITCMLGHFKNLLEEMASQPEARLCDLSLLSREEEDCLLVEWNATETDFPKERCIHSLFEEQAERTPEAVAVVCGEQWLIYRELNRRANRLAHALVAEGVGPETIVAVLDVRGVDLLGMILGVFKAGGAYLPLDPNHPRQRWVQILEQSRTPLILTSERFVAQTTEAVARIDPAHRPRMLTLEKLSTGAWPEEDLPARATPDHLAYVIYTSGSTGVPKGAMIEHKGMLNNVWGKIPKLGLTAEDVIAQTASQCFDISVWQFLTALLCGGRVQIIPDEVVHEPGSLLGEIDQARMTILEVVPSLLREMLAVEASLPLSCLRWLLPTGEALPQELCREWFKRYPGIPLLNAYGPAECADDVAFYPITAPPAEQAVYIPIGRPAGNLRLYVLDAEMRPVPIGVPGQLYIGGIGVGRGYLRDPARTAEAFVPNPFIQEPGARLYQTGDRGRWRAEGHIEFLGRMDQQVKVRGFRVELGEIEARLAEHPQVREAVVIIREDRPKEERLVAYLVTETALQPEELRVALKEMLPQYMIPSAFVFLEELPLTPNGKVDRRALPAPEISAQLEDRYVAPRTPLEEILAGIWGEVLGVERIGIHDNFFELGGHSLLAVQLLSRLRKFFKVEMTLRDLFEVSTVAELAECIEAHLIEKLEGLSEKEAQRLLIG
ncbi:MAG: amino acid adenylation domain-containing protein, partial [Pseudomonadota bacterium]|nr:amino acid adenylation domain-containing protein [Pseudomonadota bacterium]